MLSWVKQHVFDACPAAEIRENRDRGYIDVILNSQTVARVYGPPPNVLCAYLDEFQRAEQLAVFRAIVAGLEQEPNQ